jgi:hypothetical protein
MKYTNHDILFLLNMQINMVSQLMVQEKDSAAGMRYNRALKHLQLAVMELEFAARPPLIKPALTKPGQLQQVQGVARW